MTGLARRGGRSRVSATPGRSPQRSRQRIARGMVTVEMAVSLIAATTGSGDKLLGGGAGSRRGCLPYDGRSGGPSGGSRGYRVGSAGREQCTHRSQGIYDHIRRLGERDR